MEVLEIDTRHDALMADQGGRPHSDVQGRDDIANITSWRIDGLPINGYQMQQILVLKRTDDIVAAKTPVREGQR
jgi:hypothetical protein